MYKFTAEAAEMTINGDIDAHYGENLRYIDYDLQDAKDVKIYLNSGGVISTHTCCTVMLSIALCNSDGFCTH